MLNLTRIRSKIFTPNITTILKNKNNKSNFIETEAIIPKVNKLKKTTNSNGFYRISKSDYR